MLGFIVLSAVTVGVFAIDSNFYLEEPCAQVRGNCVLESECPHAVSRLHKSLCSGQQDAGAVCCKNFPQDQLNCFQQHNTCTDISDCPASLTKGPKGCPAGKTCCVLLK